MSWKLTGAAYVLAAVVLALHVERAAAASVVVDPVSFSLEASVCDCETIVDLQSSSGPLPQSVNASWPPPGLQGSVIGGGAGASATLFPALLVSASLSQANNDTGAPLGRAAASAEMTYFFMLVAKPGLGIGIGNVPVLMNGSSSLSATNSSNEGRLAIPSE